MAGRVAVVVGGGPIRALSNVFLARQGWEVHVSQACRSILKCSGSRIRSSRHPSWCSAQNPSWTVSAL